MRSAAPRASRPSACADVPGLRLEHVDRRARPVTRVGAVHHEHVREPRNRHPVVRLGARGPGLAQTRPVAADDLERSEELGGREPRAEDHDVGLVQAPVGGRDTRRADLADRRRHELDVGPRECPVPVARDQHALTADRVVRARRRPHRRILDLDSPLQIRDAGHHEARGAREQRRSPREQRHERLHHAAPGPSNGALQPWRALVDALGDSPIRRVRLRQRPWRRALEDRQARGLVGDHGDELDRAGTGADDRHALAAQVERVIPPGGVERVAGERVHTRQIGDRRPCQLPARRDQHVRVDVLPALDLEVPGPGLLVPGRLDDVLAEPQQRLQAEVAHDALEVLADLGLRREAP